MTSQFNLQVRILDEKEYTLSVLVGADDGFIVRLSGGALEDGAFQVILLSKDEVESYVSSSSLQKPDDEEKLQVRLQQKLTVINFYIVG